MLSLKLVQLESVLGIYGSSKNEFPKRMSFLEPEAALSFVRLHKLFDGLRISDMFRSPESSLQAMSEKRGVQPPGFSAHNFGLGIDIDVQSMLNKTQMTKQQLDSVMKQEGWFCHRIDSKRDFEEWHYNFLGLDGHKYIDLNKNSTAHAIESRILELHQAAFIVNTFEVQKCLSSLKLYNGEIDGIIGPRSRESIKAFQRTWKLTETGFADPRTMRTLAVVSAEKQVMSTISVV